eukprot:766956-Hanusia_phi.AAC.5
MIIRAGFRSSLGGSPRIGPGCNFGTVMPVRGRRARRLSGAPQLSEADPLSKVPGRELRLRRQPRRAPAGRGARLLPEHGQHRA